MKIELRKLTDIIPYENNPRDNEAAVDAVARSIQEFGFRQPIVVDEDGVIIVGDTFRNSYILVQRSQQILLLTY